MEPRLHPVQTAGDAVCFQKRVSVIYCGVYPHSRLNKKEDLLHVASPLVLMQILPLINLVFVQQYFLWAVLWTNCGFST